MTAHELYNILWQLKRAYAPYWGYAEVTRPCTLTHGVGPTRHTVELVAGQTVRIVMVSRLGDMGITEKLDTMYGYGLRVSPDDDLLTNCRLER